MDAREPDWHAWTAGEVCERLHTSVDGLTAEEATDRRARVGRNELSLTPPRPAWRILLDQFRSVVVALLVIAAIVAWLTADTIDAVAIGGVLALNAAIGFITELRARRAIESLSRLTPHRAWVKRPGSGSPAEIDAALLVPGDVIVLDAGAAVPADARLLREWGLRVNESPLTGESVPVSKSIDALKVETALADRLNMVYSGTTVLDGRASAVVVATGMKTEVGRIGGLVSGINHQPTPLERRLHVLGQKLVWLALAVAAAVGLLGWWQDQPWSVVIATSLALAVAAVPEGLPAVATIALAVGVRRMARRRALVRRLPSVESLGSVTVVCTDKTGTLTAGEMVATEIWTGARTFTANGNGYSPEGTLTPAATDLVRWTLEAAVRSGRGDAIQEADGRWVAHGDPTDVALLVLAGKAGLARASLEDRFPEFDEVPFSSERRMMATFHRGGLLDDRRPRVSVKGAPQAILAHSTHWFDATGGLAPLDDAARADIEQTNAAMARRGLRVIGIATRALDDEEDRALTDLALLGLVGLIDPPARGVAGTVAAFRDAGIRTIMLTGDQALTAKAIGVELGLLDTDADVVTGHTVDQWDDATLAAHLPHTHAFSRVSPEAKLRIVAGLQHAGEIVAVLGDGVNDAAALRRADVGVAMGGRGTDVARDAADIVLQDDWFPTIGAAIEEGRVIYDNIRKFVFYLFSCNLAEILVLFAAGAAGLHILSPLQILWLNLVTDTFPALALAVEPSEPGVMQRRPRPPGTALLSRSFLASIGWHAFTLAAVTLLAFVATLYAGGPAPTAAFMTLALAQLFHLGTARSRAPAVEPDRVVANPWALAAVVTVVALQIAAVTVPPLRSLLDTAVLSRSEWALIVACAAMPAILAQALRLTRARR